MAAHPVARLSAEWHLKYKYVDEILIKAELRKQGVDPDKSLEKWYDIQNGEVCYWNPPEEKTDHA